MRLPALVAATLALAACGGLNDLSDAQIPNVVDTATIAALTGTPIAQASAFSVSAGQAIRTDLSIDFDFAFDQYQSGPVLLPRAALQINEGGGLQPGLALSDEQFGELDVAPIEGFLTRDTVAIAVGQVFAARSRVVCGGLGVPLYGKLRILALDATARTVTFEFLVNENCGYVGLEPGIPER